MAINSRTIRAVMPTPEEPFEGIVYDSARLGMDGIDDIGDSANLYSPLRVNFAIAGPDNEFAVKVALPRP
jgi:hypothetical protein